MCCNVSSDLIRFLPPVGFSMQLISCCLIGQKLTDRIKIWLKHPENFGGNFGFGSLNRTQFQTVSVSLAPASYFGNILNTKRIKKRFATCWHHKTDLMPRWHSRGQGFDSPYLHQPSPKLRQASQRRQRRRLSAGALAEEDFFHVLRLSNSQ